MPFIELDREIEKEPGMPLAEIFSLYGQSGYRAIEKRTLERVLQEHDRAVFSIGGGVVSEKETYDYLLSHCYTVWIKAQPEEHMSRVIAQGDFRAMAGSDRAMEDLRRILEAREPLYRKADMVLDTSGSIGRRKLFAKLKTALEDNFRSRQQEDSWMLLQRKNLSPRIEFRRLPGRSARYKHWRLSFEAPVATLTMDVAEDGGLRPGYKLKLNSYDLGVDIELHDALQRIRFEHPEIRSVVITSAKNRIFCSGRQHLHARPFFPRLESEFLQIHERNAEWHRGFQRSLRPQISRGTATERPPAAATNWRWPATKSFWWTIARRL